MDWWISPAGKIISAPRSERISYEVNGYQGPYASRAAAQAAQGTGSGGGSWYVVSEQVGTGKVTVTNYLAAQKPFPQNATEVSGPYATRAEANAAANTQKLKAISAPSLPSLPSLPNPLAGLSSIGDFFGRLTQASTWVRVGEVILGLVLIAIGIARMTHAVPIATKIATKAGAAAVL